MEIPTFYTPLTIFIVDDNPVDVSMMRWVLDAHELDYHLRVIDNGDHARRVFHRLAQQKRLRSPTIVLLDLYLPPFDGKEVLRHIKALPLGAEIHVVVVTGSQNPADQQETLALGADAYFVKPYHLNEFMELGHLIKHLVFDHAPSFTQSAITTRSAHVHERQRPEACPSPLSLRFGV
jgi:CheY-like chemotaxis protein